MQKALEQYYRQNYTAALALLEDQSGDSAFREYVLGLTHFRLEHFDFARDSLERFHGNHKGNFYSYMHLARAQDKTGMRNAACESMLAALSFNPHAAEAWLQLALWQRSRGLKARSRISISNAFVLKPVNEQIARYYGKISGLTPGHSGIEPDLNLEWLTIPYAHLVHKEQESFSLPGSATNWDVAQSLQNSAVAPQNGSSWKTMVPIVFLLGLYAGMVVFLSFYAPDKSQSFAIQSQSGEAVPAQTTGDRNAR
ncbi:MAG: hypothetical protein KDK39_04235 [Leptospiraceae bacterium]|nr:hypothetical protein [Leptospiraceae bacterium]